ncbi:MAG: hypothetical protein IT210_01465 [Armatimonadetes bacterium]|nr:hypothetical protein [Armatimonadota bacterium]
MEALDVIFIGCLFVGVFYALLQFVIGGVGHIADGFGGGDGLTLDHGGIGDGQGIDGFQGDSAAVDAGGDMGGDAGDQGASPLNSMTIGAFITGFGGFGVIARSLGWSPLASTVFASIMAFLTAAMVFMVFVKLIVAAQSSSHFRRVDILGKPATVIIALEENRLGSIAYTVRGVRQTAPALSDNGKPIGKGAPVEIVRMSGGTVYVREREG